MPLIPPLNFAILTFFLAFVEIVNPDPFAVSLDEWISGHNINFISAYAAAQEAVAGWKQLPAITLKTFAFTGNVLIHTTVPLLMHLGVSKNAAAHMIQCAAMRYEKEGLR